MPGISMIACSTGRVTVSIMSPSGGSAALDDRDVRGNWAGINAARQRNAASRPHDERHGHEHGSARMTDRAAATFISRASRAFRSRACPEIVAPSKAGSPTRSPARRRPAAMISACSWSLSRRDDPALGLVTIGDEHRGFPASRTAAGTRITPRCSSAIVTAGADRRHVRAER